MAKKTPEAAIFKIYFEGDIDELVLVFILKKLSQTQSCPKQIKSSLKIILIEIITNIISHHSFSNHGIISIKGFKGYCLIEAGNFANKENIEVIKANIDEVKKVKNIKDHYKNLLKSVSYEKSVNLGLIEIYNRSKGNLKLETQEILGKSFITFKIKIDDIN